MLVSRPCAARGDSPNVTRVNEHLLNVLSQLHCKEAEHGQAQEALEKFQRDQLVHTNDKHCGAYNVPSRVYRRSGNFLFTACPDDNFVSTCVHVYAPYTCMESSNEN